MNSFIKNIRATVMLAFLLGSLAACDSQGEGDYMSPPERSDNTGEAGSMARFGLSGNQLYVVGNDNLRYFDISDPRKPVFQNTINLPDGVETIFPYGNHLFLGTMNGVIIMNISNPLAPIISSTYSHVTSCDPVVVQNNYAYVTMRNGTACNRGINRLDVLDVSRPEAPALMTAMGMINPHGLGVEGSQLFVCEGASGIKAFDISTPTRPKMVQLLNGFDAFDLIVDNGLLMVIGKTGLMQFQYDTSPQAPNMRLVSRINIGS